MRCFGLAGPFLTHTALFLQGHRGSAARGEELPRRHCARPRNCCGARGRRATPLCSASTTSPCCCTFLLCSGLPPALACGQFTSLRRRKHHRGFFSDVAADLAHDLESCNVHVVCSPAGLENDQALLSAQLTIGGIIVDADMDTDLFPERSPSQALTSLGHIRLNEGIHGPSLVTTPSSHRLDTYASSHAEAAKRARERAPHVQAAQAALLAAKVLFSYVPCHGNQHLVLFFCPGGRGNCARPSRIGGPGCGRRCQEDVGRPQLVPSARVSLGECVYFLSLA